MGQCLGVLSPPSRPGTPRDVASHPQRLGLSLSEASDLKRRGGRGQPGAGGQLGRSGVCGRDDLRDDPHPAGVGHRGGRHRLRAERGLGTRGS